MCRADRTYLHIPACHWRRATFPDIPAVVCGAHTQFSSTANRIPEAAQLKTITWEMLCVSRRDANRARTPRRFYISECHQAAYAGVRVR